MSFTLLFLHILPQPQQQHTKMKTLSQKSFLKKGKSEPQMAGYSGPYAAGLGPGLFFQVMENTRSLL